MGETIYCNITVRVPATWHTDPLPWMIADLIEALWDLCDDGSWDDTDNTYNVSGFANYGSNDDQVGPALEILRALRIPFQWTEEGGPEWAGTTEFFDGNESKTNCWDANLGTVMCRSDWQAILEQTSVNSRRVAIVDAFFNDTERRLTDASIDHLPVLIPERVTCTGTRGYYMDPLTHDKPCPVHSDATWPSPDPTTKKENP